MAGGKVQGKADPWSELALCCPIVFLLCFICLLCAVLQGCWGKYLCLCSQEPGDMSVCLQGDQGSGPPSLWAAQSLYWGTLPQ